MPALKRVLLIEDHDDSRLALYLALKHAKFEVSAYDLCAAAEHHLDARDVDIALLDVRLSGRSGDDFAKELRSKCPKTMIVFVTGEAILEPLKEAVPDCFVIRKPIDIHVLLELLECFCSDRSYSSTMKTFMHPHAGPGHI